MTARQNLIIAITGASGAIYGINLLKLLQDIPEIETHLVISDAGKKTIVHETGLTVEQVESLADHVYSQQDIGAAIASGSFESCGMVVAPCSMRTLAAVANGFCDNLITRAADVILKERKILVLMTRETPLNLAHLRNMASVTEMNGIIFPPVPSFYDHPQNIDAMVNQTLRSVMALFRINDGRLITWKGLSD